MLRGMIASTYRIIVVLYRRFDLRRGDLHHRFANFSWRLVSCDLNDGDISILASKRIRKCIPDEGVIHGDPRTMDHVSARSALYGHIRNSRKNSSLPVGRFWQGACAG
jgi:hypothetical protein